MNLKRIIALALVLLFSANGTASNVFAMKPQGSSSNLELDSLNTPSILEGSLLDDKVKPNANNHVAIKDVLKKILNFKKIDDKRNFEKATTLKRVLELFANEECYENQLPNEYKEVMNEFSNTDFYTVKSKQDNFQSKFENIEMKIFKITASISKIEQDFNTYKIKLTVNKDKLNKSSEAREYGASVCDYCESFFAVKAIEIKLDKSYEDITKIREQIEDIQKNKNETYERLYSKYSKNEGEIYSYIAKIIKTQGEKYDLQAEGLLNLISQTQQTILNLKNDHVSPTVKENSAFFEKNPGIKHTYGLAKDFFYFQKNQKAFQKNQRELQQEQSKLQREQSKLQQEQSKLQEEKTKLKKEKANLKKEKSDLAKKNADLAQENASLIKEIRLQRVYSTTLEDYALNLQNKLFQQSNKQPVFVENETQTTSVLNLEECNETENEPQATSVQNLEEYNKTENEPQPMPEQNPKECEPEATPVQNSEDTNSTPGASINSSHLCSPISKSKAKPDIENQNLVDKEISEIFKDYGFAKYVYTYILRKGEPFALNYKLTQLDVHAIENESFLTFVNCKNNINSLSGIEYFINLSSLTCQNYNLDSIDLSKNIKLEHLDLSTSTLKNGLLDLSKNSNLERLNCRKCGINKVILPNTKTTEIINLSSNNISGKLDLSPFKNLQNVNLASNNITGLTIASENAITELNISENENFGDFDFNILSNLTKLNCSKTNRQSLLVNNLKNLTNLIFSENEDLTEVDISNCTKLRELNCDGCFINKLDLSTLTSLQFFDCSFNNIKNLAFKSDKLIKISFIGNPIEVVYLPEVFRNNPLDYDNRYTCKDLNGFARIDYK